MLKLTLSFFKSGLLSLGLIYNKSKIHPRLIPPRWAFVNFWLSITLALKFRIQSIVSQDKNLKRFDRKKDTTGLKLKIETFFASRRICTSSFPRSPSSQTSTTRRRWSGRRWTCGTATSIPGKTWTAPTLSQPLYLHLRSVVLKRRFNNG